MRNSYSLNGCDDSNCKRNFERLSDASCRSVTVMHGGGSRPLHFVLLRVSSQVSVFRCMKTQFSREFSWRSPVSKQASFTVSCSSRAYTCMSRQCAHHSSTPFLGLDSASFYGKMRRNTETTVKRDFPGSRHSTLTHRCKCTYCCNVAKDVEKQEGQKSRKTFRPWF
jgi:hypothetical protein